MKVEIMESADVALEQWGGILGAGLPCMHKW